MPLDFMSQDQFDKGGPYGSALGTATGGFGQLAQAIAQGPRIRAQAGLTAAETGKAQAETQGLIQQQGLVSDRAKNIAELRDLISDPALFSDPAKRSRAVAIVNADPDLSKNSQAILGTAIGMATLNHAISAADRDAFVGATGGAPYGSTQTGYTANLANERELEAQRQAGATGRTVLEQQGANYRTPQYGRPQDAPPGSPVGTYTLSDAYAQHITPVGPALQGQEATLVPTVPAGSPAGTVPVDRTQGSVAASNGGYTQIGPAQQAAEAAPTTVIGADGRPTMLGTGVGTATGAQPILGGGPTQVQGVGIQGTSWPNNRPIDLSQPGSTATPPAASTAPPPTANPPTAPQPPASNAPPAPTPPNTPTLGDAFGGAAFGSTPPAPGPNPAQRVGTASIEATGGVMPKGSDAQEAVNRQNDVKGLGATLYPAGVGPTGGQEGTLGPAAQAKILARASELTDTRGSPYVNNWSGAVTRAVQELQATGQLPPDASQSADWKRTAHIQGKNVIELAPAGTYTPVTQGGPAQGAQTGTVSTTMGPVLASPSTGTFWRDINGQRVQTDAQGNPLGAAPGVTTAKPPAAPTSSGPTIRWPFSNPVAAAPRAAPTATPPLVPGHDPRGVLASPFVRRLQETFGGGG